MSAGEVAGSRLARMIARLITQRACLEWAAAEIREIDGPVLELGLGKGRTYDHLRRLLPDREILVFDRFVHAPRDCVPPGGTLVLGELRKTVADATARLAGRVALIHADIGSGDRSADSALGADLAPHLAALPRPGGLVLCDRELALDGFDRVPLPPGAADWCYFIYRTPNSEDH